MNTTYPVLNPGFARLGRPQLGIGPMDQSAVDALQEEADNLFGSTFFEMSAESQMAMQSKKDECLDWVEDAKRDREVDTYNTAVQCMADARREILSIIEEEQGVVEDYPPPEDWECPEGFTSSEEG